MHRKQTIWILIKILMTSRGHVIKGQNEKNALNKCVKILLLDCKSDKFNT